MPGPVALAFGGAALSGLGSYFGAREQRKGAENAAKIAAAAGAFRPFDITGIGGTGVDLSSGDARLLLDPKLAAIRSQLLGDAGQMFGPAQNFQQTLFGAGNQLFPSATGIAGAGLDPTAVLGALNIDPNAIAGNQFNLGMNLLAPQQERERLALENRLLAQGMFGSTGGAEHMRALREAQNNAQAQLAFSALSQGIQNQGQILNQAIGAGESLFSRGLSGTQLASSLFGQGIDLEQMRRANLMQDLSTIAGIEDRPLPLLQMAAAIGGRPNQGGIVGAGMLNQAAQNYGDMIAGFGGGLGRSISNLAFTPTGTTPQNNYYGGGYISPTGRAAPSTLFGSSDPYGDVYDPYAP